MRAAIVALLGACLTLPAIPATAQPTNSDLEPFGCQGGGILTQVSGNYFVDLATGDYEPMPAVPELMNGVGFNPTDNLVYGWAYGGEGIGRFGADGGYEFLGLPDGLTVDNWNTGDVDAEGYLWLATSGRRVNWAQIDVRAGSDTFGELVDSGMVERPAGVASSSVDWAFSPTDPTGLYLLGFGDGARTQLVLDRFDTGTHTREKVADLGTFEGVRAFGALYADADGFVYGSDNDSGTIVRADIAAGTADVFSAGPASSVNDGAACASTIIPLDFGDAPDSYGSLLADDGPRHALREWTEDVAPLQLGSSVTREPDALTADADDALATAPEAIAGVPTSVEVEVTNSTDTGALLSAWFDTAIDGAFDETDAIAPVEIPAGSGTTTVSLELPAASAHGESWLRLRLADADTLTPMGPASGGEVEDWPVQVSAGTPGITVVKDVAEATFAAAGDTLDYSVEVTNSGDVPLTEVEVADPLCTLSGGRDTLDVAESTTFTCTYEVTAEDVSAESVVNTVSATGSDQFGTVATASDDATATYELTEPTEDPTDEPSGPSDPLEPSDGPETEAPTADSTENAAGTTDTATGTGSLPRTGASPGMLAAIGAALLAALTGATLLIMRRRAIG
ncbi:conserved repeat domain-containing protein [Ruania alba]|uniref:Conserved repeat domain-containing protein n=2 Tax=Ruania alba TaxID=648782 RepID=A0A1H5GR24_9MICO|nr:conserved repeat domain-containing protein [Ruania alba]